MSAEPRHIHDLYPAAAPQPGDAWAIRRDDEARALELNDEAYLSPMSDLEMDEFAEHLRLDAQIEADLDALMAQSGVRRADVDRRIQELIEQGVIPGVTAAKRLRLALLDREWAREHLEARRATGLRP